MGALAAVGGLTAVGGLAHFRCILIMVGGLAAGGLAAPFLVGGLAAPPSRPEVDGRDIFKLFAVKCPFREREG